jgi:hypothetical protein
VVNKDKSAAEKVAGPSKVAESIDKTEEESEHVPALERLGRTMLAEMRRQTEELRRIAAIMTANVQEVENIAWRLDDMQSEQERTTVQVAELVETMGELEVGTWPSEASEHGYSSEMIDGEVRELVRTAGVSGSGSVEDGEKEDETMK